MMKVEGEFGNFIGIFVPAAPLTGVAPTGDTDIHELYGSR